MIPNCKGCVEELEHALGYQDILGLHLATSLDNELFSKKHVHIIMVDCKGKIMVW